MKEIKFYLSEDSSYLTMVVLSESYEERYSFLLRQNETQTECQALIDDVKSTSKTKLSLRFQIEAQRLPETLGNLIPQILIILTKSIPFSFLPFSDQEYCIQPHPTCPDKRIATPLSDQDTIEVWL